MSDAEKMRRVGLTIKHGYSSDKDAKNKAHRFADLMGWRVKYHSPSITQFSIHEDHDKHHPTWLGVGDIGVLLAGLELLHGKEYGE